MAKKPAVKKPKVEYSNPLSIPNVLKAYKELLDREFCDLHWAKKTYRFKWENWKELGKKAEITPGDAAFIKANL